MANMKIRGERDSADAQGPQNGPNQPMDIGATSIPDKPAMGTRPSHPTSGPRTQPNSSLGARRVKRYNGGCKA